MISRFQKRNIFNQMKMNFQMMIWILLKILIKVIQFLYFNLNKIGTNEKVANEKILHNDILLSKQSNRENINSTVPPIPTNLPGKLIK